MSGPLGDEPGGGDVLHEVRSSGRRTGVIVGRIGDDALRVAFGQGALDMIEKG